MIVNMGRLLRESARRFADNIALVNVERDRRFTYRKLHELTNQICNMMRDRFNLRQGDIYGILLENDNASLISMWCLKGYPSALWLNIKDSLEEHLYQIDFVQPKLIFIESTLLAEYHAPLTARGITIICMDQLEQPLENVHDFWQLIEDSSPAEVEAEVNFNDTKEHVAAYKFTGGTTGKGKCVLESISNLFLSAICYCAHPENHFSQQTKFLLSTPVTHASGPVVLPVYMKGGATLTLNRVDLELLCQTVEREQATMIYAVPTVLYRLLDKGLEKKYNLSSLDTIRYGAAPISPAKLESLMAIFGPVFVQGYGATEAYTPITLLGKSEHSITTEKDRVRLTSVGRPVPGAEVRIVGEKGEELPPGVQGEIWIRGTGVVDGYFKDPEQTLENFTTNGFFKSGDLGYIDEEGYLYLKDRKKDMIISGGFNVYATEVENVVNSHPKVRECVVVGIPHEEWGEAVHAEVILAEQEEQLSVEELIGYCKTRLSGYKVPKSILFVTELPLSPAGKVLKRKVREKYWLGKDRRIY